MTTVNTDNLKRSMEEDLLIDNIAKPPSLMIEGTDSYADLDGMNSRLKSIDNKIQSLLALILIKESTILTEKKDDAIEGSIFFNKENNTLEYFNGQSWEGNIFGPNTILDYKSFSVDDLGKNNSNSGSYASVSSIRLNMALEENQILFLISDGDILDESFYYLDSKDQKLVHLSQPISVYDNLSYYILGSESLTSGTIPRYEVMEYVSDGSKNIFNLSNNRDFITTYKSSIMVIVDGKILRESEYELSLSRNQVILNSSPELGSKIEIRTLYGVTTDFRSSISYVEQIMEAEVDRQKTFQYNGVSDALKVYLNGIRMISGKDFKFNYVQKMVVFEDDVADNIRKGDTVIVEQEMSPMSEIPMQGKIITETFRVNGDNVNLSYECNGVISVYILENQNIQLLLSNEYYITNKVLTILKQNINGKDIQVTYLTNSSLTSIETVTIDDSSSSDVNRTWSNYKIMRELNSKADSFGNKSQDFNTRDLNVHGMLTLNGSGTTKGDFNISGKISSKEIDIGDENSLFIKQRKELDSIEIGKNLQVRNNLTVLGDFRVEGQQIGQIQETLNVNDNKIILNNNLSETDTPPSSSGLIINRGQNGESKILFDENDSSWVVYTDEIGENKKISLDGHKHTINDFDASGVPNFKAISSTNNTTDIFYSNGEYVNLLEDLLTNTDKLKSLSRLYITPESSLNGELASNKSEVLSGNILRYTNYFSILENGVKRTNKNDVFSIIEDGSIISNSSGCLKLPSGPTNKRWENDSTYCGVDGNTFLTKLESLEQNWQNTNGLIRYNTEEKCVEIKIDNSWVKFYKPDVKTTKQQEMSYSRGRFINSYSKSDFIQLTSNDQVLNSSLGFQVGEWVLKIEHNLNSLYVDLKIFDDKRTPFPLLYKCVDENNAFVYFPSNITQLSSSNDLLDWFSFLSTPLHSNNISEGPGHNNNADTMKQLELDKKLVVIVNAI